MYRSLCMIRSTVDYFYYYGSLELCGFCSFFFFFSSRRRHTRFDCDWSSDVCSSDLAFPPARMSERSLAYVSPEQTGRMNRKPDYRTDFYSLGVTLYQMLTHRLPFERDRKSVV